MDVPQTHVQNERAETHEPTARAEFTCQIHLLIVPNGQSRDNER